MGGEHSVSYRSRWTRHGTSWPGVISSSHLCEDHNVMSGADKIIPATP